MAVNRKTDRPGPGPHILMGHANVLAEIGPETLNAASELCAMAGEADVLAQRLKDVFKTLADELDRAPNDREPNRWHDNQVAQVITALKRRLSDSQGHLDLAELERLDLPILS